MTGKVSSRKLLFNNESEWVNTGILESEGDQLITKEEAGEIYRGLPQQDVR